VLLEESVGLAIGTLVTLSVHSFSPDPFFSCCAHDRQPSDQYSDVGRAPDVTPPRESTNMEADHALLFAPAEHTDSMKRRKDRRRKERQERTPRTKNSSKQTTPTKASHHNNHSITVESRQGTPPTARPPKAMLYEKDEEEDVWYAKWWMFCFPDAVRSMTPKR
jgi:hypothetical protein